MAPYASRVPFEVSIVPRDHSPRFEEASDDTLKALAEAFRCVMPAVDWALERPAYNVVLHTAPFDGSADPALHWRLDILPRVTRFSGREWATGMYRNPVAPEEAARVEVETPYGRIGVKVGRRGGRVYNAQPEFEDCQRVALERGVAVKEVWAAALTAWRAARG
jgi:diadenosine tetraphosphate (Ap4A) HIT family hydrolase